MDYFFGPACAINELPNYISECVLFRCNIKTNPEFFKKTQNNIKIISINSYLKLIKFFIKNHYATIYINWYNLSSLLSIIFTKNTIFMTYQQIIEWSIKINNVLKLVFLFLVKKIRLIIDWEAALLQSLWISKKWIKIPLVVDWYKIVNKNYEDYNNILFLWRFVEFKDPETIFAGLWIVCKSHKEFIVHHFWCFDTTYTTEKSMS